MNFSGRRGIASKASIGAAALVLPLLALLLLQLFESGRVLTIRSYLRLERAWTWYFPFTSGRDLLVRRLEPHLLQSGLLRPVRVEVEPGVSLLLDSNDVVSRSILRSLTSQWEAPVWDAISEGLSDGAVFFDVGAHIGYYSLKASRRVGAEGLVVAFEPNPRTVAALEANIAASGIRNISVQPIACVDTETTLTLFDASFRRNTGAASLSEQNAGAGAHAYAVRGRPIDAVVQELGLTRLDVFKADVEGAELLVLTGAANTLKRFHPRLILEVAPGHLSNMGTSVIELERFVRSLGYDTSRTIDHMNRVWTVTRHK